MEIKNYFAQDAQGNIMPSANCYLYLPGTTTLATGLIDGNGTPISNPFLASSVGQIEFGAPNGVYDLRVALGARDWTIKVQCADIVQAMDVMDSILGSHTENPATRNNGQPLQPGDETWNPTEKQPFWWDGSIWVALNSGAKKLEEKLLDPNNGAGHIALGASFSYPQGTVGSASSVFDTKFFGIKADGSDETVLFRSVALQLEDTGYELRLSKGVIGVTGTVDIKGFTFRAMPGTAVKGTGSTQAAFVNGALRCLAYGFVYGTVYSSGTMVAAFASGFASRPAMVFVADVTGGFFGSAYSQIYGAVKTVGGSGTDARTWGGVYRGLFSELSLDVEHHIKHRWYNAGVAYRDMIPFSFAIQDCQASSILLPSVITNPITLDVDGNFSTKNGLWVQGTGVVTDAQAELLIHNGEINRAGYYKDASGATKPGHGAGTCIEVLNAPHFQTKSKTRSPSGYNVAIASGSNGAQVEGLHIGNGGDPVVVVANSHDCIIGGTLDRGTVAASIGEDGATSNNTIVTATIKNMSSAPVQFGSGRGLSLLGAKIYGEPTLASAVGSWSGPGEVKPVVRVMGEANDITVMGCSVQGYFNQLVVDRSGATGRLRVTDKGNELACPIIARIDSQRSKLHQNASSSDFIRVLNDNDITGASFVGEISLPSSGATYLASPINPLLSNLADMAVAAGETIEEIYSKYAITVYIRYVPGMIGQQVKFGLASSSTASHVQATFFGQVFGAVGAPQGNSIGGVWHPLTEGEWVPLDMPLNTIIYSGANPAALTNFIVFKSTNPTLYDLTITKPTLTYIGSTPRA